MDPQLLTALLNNNPQAVDMFLASQDAVMPGRQSDESPFTKGSDRALQAIAKSRELRKQIQTLDKEERAQAMWQGISNLGIAMMEKPITGQTILPMIARGISGYNQAANAIQLQKARDYEMAMQQQQREHERRQQMLLHLLPYMQMTAAQQEAARHAKALEAQNAEANQYKKELLKSKLLKDYASMPASVTEEGRSLEEYIPLDRKAREKIFENKRAGEHMLEKARDINKQINDFDKLTENSFISPLNPYAYGTNTVKDITGYVGSSLFPNKKPFQQLEKERRARNQLDADLRNFNMEIERAVRGGTVTDQMAKMYEQYQVLPNTNQSMADLKGKFGKLMEGLEKEKQANQLSLKYNRHISPLTLSEIQKQKLQGTEGTPLAESPIKEKIRTIREKIPQFDKFSDAQVLEWASSRGI